VQRDSIAVVARQSLEFDELSEQIMEEATIDEAVWFSVVGMSLHQKQRLPESFDKKPANKFLLVITFFISSFRCQSWALGSVNRSLILPYPSKQNPLLLAGS
jgi:hypothetical protein